MGSFPEDPANFQHADEAVTSAWSASTEHAPEQDLTDSVSSEGVSSEGVSPEGVSPDGVSPDGAWSEGMLNAASHGHGDAADGQVTAAVDTDGRVVDLRLDPALLRSDANSVAEAVRAAVNSAQDDLTEHLASGDLAGLDAELGRVTADFDRALDRMHDDSAETQRRLGY